MKNLTLTILTTTIALTLVSCGPSQAELEAREKAKMDSVSKATTDALIAQQKQDSATQRQQMEDEAKAIADSIAGALEASLQNENCKELRVQLAAAEDKLTEIKEWKLGRTPAEKEQQLTEQYRLIEELKDQLKNCN